MCSDADKVYRSYAYIVRNTRTEDDAWRALVSSLPVPGFLTARKTGKKNSGISAWSHLRWTALDHHEASFADATGLHGDGRRRTSIGSLELLNIIMV
jgi:hypothetical protein